MNKSETQGHCELYRRPACASDCALHRLELEHRRIVNLAPKQLVLADVRARRARKGMPGSGTRYWCQVLYTRYLVPDTVYQMFGTSCFIPGTCCQVLGTRYLVPDAWYQMRGTKYLVPDTCYQVLGTRCLLPGTWYKGLGAKFLVVGAWYQMFGTRCLVPESC